MKLATFTHDGVTRIGLVEGQEVVDVTAAQPDLPRDMLALLEAGPDALEAAREAAATARRLALADVRLEAPIARRPSSWRWASTTPTTSPSPAWRLRSIPRSSTSSPAA